MTISGKLGALAGLMLLASCGTENAAAPLAGGPAGRIRFVNLIADPARVPVNAILETVPFGVNLGYTAATPAALPAPATAFYAPILVGSRSLVLKRTADTTVTVATLALTIAANEDRTVYAFGGTAGAAVQKFETIDDNPAAASNVTRLRVVNMSAAAVDVFVTAAGADLTTATPNASALGARAASTYFTMAPGTYQVRFVPAATAAAARNGAVTLTIAAQAYAGGAGRTLVAADAAAGGTPLRGFVLGDR